MDRVPEFDEYLDMEYQVMSMVGLEFYPSQVLFACDPTAYRIYAQEYLDLLEEDK
jgi:hypothetical protein